MSDAALEKKFRYFLAPEFLLGMITYCVLSLYSTACALHSQ